MPRLNLCNEFPGVRVGARRVGDDELKRRPALLQCLFGLQCQSRPTALHIREDGLQSWIWRVCAHPLTVSGPKPAFKWSKHRRPPNAGSRAIRTAKPLEFGKQSLSGRYSLPHRSHLCPNLDAPSVRYSTQHHSILVWCCADHTHSVPRYCPRNGIASWRVTNRGAQTPRNPGRASSACRPLRLWLKFFNSGARQPTKNPAAGGARAGLSTGGSPWRA
jgi:hypothetical protein